MPTEVLKEDIKKEDLGAAAFAPRAATTHAEKAQRNVGQEEARQRLQEIADRVRAAARIVDASRWDGPWSDRLVMIHLKGWIQEHGITIDKAVAFIAGRAEATGGGVKRFRSVRYFDDAIRDHLGAWDGDPAAHAPTPGQQEEAAGEAEAAAYAYSVVPGPEGVELDPDWIQPDTPASSGRRRGVAHRSKRTAKTKPGKAR